ncbi:MAG: MEDS domain-containing protein [Arenimonas sp.]
MDSRTRSHHHASDPLPHPGPCGHLVQFYADHSRLLDSLETFCSAGLDTGEAVVVIATPPHLHALEARLQGRGIDLVAARNENRYLPFGAHDAMDRFIVDAWPDKGRFTTFLEATLARARGTGRKVRAFGEMVAVLWANGDRDAALQLERLWCEVCERGQLTLLCAYPTAAFSGIDDPNLAMVRALHTEGTPGG